MFANGAIFLLVKVAMVEAQAKMSRVATLARAPSMAAFEDHALVQMVAAHKVDHLPVTHLLGSGPAYSRSSTMPPDLD